MTFTYNLSSTNADILLISKVRLELGDTAVGAGVRPNNANIADEEILSWLSEEDDDVIRTVGRAAFSLANIWASAAMSVSVGPYSESYGKVSDVWSKRFEDIQKQVGAVLGGGLQSSQLGRKDGYSQNNSMTGSEYVLTGEYSGGES
jgi:hypothetical protein